MADYKKAYLYKGLTDSNPLDITNMVDRDSGWGQIHRKLEKDGRIFYDRIRLPLSIMHEDIANYSDYTDLIVTYNGHNIFWGKVDWDNTEVSAYPTADSKADLIRIVEGYDPLKDLKGEVNYGTALSGFSDYRYIGQYFKIDSHSLTDGLHTIKCTPEENNKHTIRKCALQLNDGNADVYDEDLDVDDGKKLYDSEGNWVVLKRGVSAGGWNYIRNEFSMVNWWEWNWRLENTWVEDTYKFKAKANVIYVPPFCLTLSELLTDISQDAFAGYDVDLNISAVNSAQIMSPADVTNKITIPYGAVEDVISFPFGNHRWLGVITHTSTNRYFILFVKSGGTWYERTKRGPTIKAGEYGGEHPEFKMRLVKRKSRGIDDIERVEYNIVVMFLDEWIREKIKLRLGVGEWNYGYFYRRGLKGGRIIRMWDDASWTDNALGTTGEKVDGETLDINPLTSELVGMTFLSEIYTAEDPEDEDNELRIVKLIPNNMGFFDFYKEKATYYEFKHPSPFVYKQEIRFWQDPIQHVKANNLIYDTERWQTNVRVENPYNEQYSVVSGARMDISGKDLLVSGLVRLDSPYFLLAYKNKYFRPTPTGWGWDMNQTPFGLLRKQVPLLYNPTFQYLNSRTFPDIDIGLTKICNYNMMDDEYCKYSETDGNITVYQNYHKNTIRLDDFSTFKDSLEIVDYLRQIHNAVLTTDVVSKKLKMYKIGKNEVKDLKEPLEEEITLTEWDRQVTGVEIAIGDTYILAGTHEGDVLKLKNPIPHNAGYYWIWKALVEEVYAFYSQSRQWLRGLQASILDNEGIQIGDIITFNSKYWLIIDQKDDLDNETMRLEAWEIFNNEVG